MKQFLVYMTCNVRKMVTVECETIEQAEENPWDYETDCVEIDQIDWEIDDVTEYPD